MIGWPADLALDGPALRVMLPALPETPVDADLP